METICKPKPTIPSLQERRIVGQPVAFDLSLGKDTRHRAGMPSPLPLLGSPVVPFYLFFGGSLINPE